MVVFRQEPIQIKNIKYTRYIDENECHNEEKSRRE